MKSFLGIVKKTNFDKISFNRSEYNGNRTISKLWVNGKYHVLKKN